MPSSLHLPADSEAPRWAPAQLDASNKPARRWRLDLAYDGKGFHRWAVQAGLRTLQGPPEEWISTVLRTAEPVQLTVAGRTDAGVHARGQVAHLDLAATGERGLRRAELPLEDTRGFNPRPRLQFAAALPVGLTSEAELVDVWLTERVSLDPPSVLIERLNYRHSGPITTGGFQTFESDLSEWSLSLTHATPCIWIKETDLQAHPPA